MQSAPLEPIGRVAAMFTAVSRTRSGPDRVAVTPPHAQSQPQQIAATSPSLFCLPQRRFKHFDHVVVARFRLLRRKSLRSCDCLVLALGTRKSLLQATYPLRRSVPPSRAPVYSPPMANHHLGRRDVLTLAGLASLMPAPLVSLIKGRTMTTTPQQPDTRRRELYALLGDLPIAGGQSAARSGAKRSAMATSSRRGTSTSTASKRSRRISPVRED